jgi:predicted nucleotidyltransferase
LSTIPIAVIKQLEQFCQEIVDLLRDDLVGIYLHGSLAMGCFNPKHSDMDVLVVSQAAIPLPVKAELGRLLLRLSLQPIPIEIHFLNLAGLHPWRYPPPFDLHYSEPWRDRLERDLATGGWLQWDDHERLDADLGAHIMVARERGAVLCGAPLMQTFPKVPAADYLAAVKYDIEDAFEKIGETPVYHTLNLCRTLAYTETGQVMSKAEGGIWALEHLPAALHPTIRTALDFYQHGQSSSEFSPTALAELLRYMREKIGFF